MENIEITDEMLKRWEIESGNERFFAPHIVSALCKALKSERAERAKNPGVWDGAPKDAIAARIFYSDVIAKAHDPATTYYTRELPKTKAREIAERIAEKQTEYGVERWRDQKKWLADCIESAILEAQAQSN